MSSEACGTSLGLASPLRTGGSCGHYKITAGTLGGFVEDQSGYYMMSNNHVFANSNQCFGADPILQPGPIDITGKFHTIGLLERWFPLSKSGSTGIDVAVAGFSDEVAFFEPWRYAGVGTIRSSLHRIASLFRRLSNSVEQPEFDAAPSVLSNSTVFRLTMARLPTQLS